jgi:hypothetical protein
VTVVGRLSWPALEKALLSVINKSWVRFMTCLACAGAAVVIAGILLSIGWLILVGGLGLLIGALAVPSARLHR